MNAAPFSTAPLMMEDPRSRPDFMARYYPLANGKKAPALCCEEQNDRIMLEFLAAYYFLNCAHAKLVEIRAAASSTPSDAERAYLPEVDKLLIFRDELEDRYAPRGVLAQPVIKDGFTLDVRFSFGNADSRGRPRTDLFRLTAHIPIPLPPGAKLRDYIVDFKGPEPFIPPPE
jgi:hypothetical protein